jgi:hypothetical protein
MKKTAVRVQEFKDEKLGFGFANLQILMPTSAGLEPIGDIQFQRTLSNGPDGNWYGLHYKVDCTHPNIKHLRQMNKIADLVVAKCKEENLASYDLQPFHVLDALNAERYGVFQHEFVRLDQAGEIMYDVMFLGSVYSRIVAPDEAAAKKILKKKKLNKHELVVNAVVQFPKL